ncbi:MAG: hypothetical protein HOP30_21690 [Cyclobacteriaceae bacterium]|nr:hypothetical protein [Cyclobacteriaceae bacterium]
MKSDITIGPYKQVKANSFTWNTSLENFSDSALIKLPAITSLKKEGDEYDRVQTGLQLKEGLKVDIKAGYDGITYTRFRGFIRRINFTVPLELDCEGYSYQLRKVLDFTKAYKKTTVRKMLEDLTQGTDIKLSESIPHIPIDKATFKNVTGIQVLEWFKEKCLLTVYFNFDTLYVGALALEPKASQKFRLGWNVIKDNDLKFNDEKEFVDVRITIESRAKSGVKEQAYDGNVNGQNKILRTAIRDKSIQNQIAVEKRKQLVTRGYEGSITTFLVPFVVPGDTAVIDDTKYPQRIGRYFITGVEGSFNSGGGRQKVKIGHKLSA